MKTLLAKNAVRLAGAAAAVLLALPAQAQAGAFDIARLRPYTAEYEILAEGNPVGAVTNRVAPEGDGWAVRMNVTFGPVQQTITTVWGPGWEPRSYGETYAGGMEGRVDARVENGRITGAAALPPQAGGARTYDAEAVAGVAFSEMDDAMLAAADLAEGRTLTIPVFDSSTGQVKQVSYAVGAVESVTVPAGTFRAYRVQESGGASPLVLWLRADGPHVVVRQEVVGQPIVVQLKSIQ
jgi:hypothetical protein